jgi:hypothetical protein
MADGFGPRKLEVAVRAGRVTAGGSAPGASGGPGAEVTRAGADQAADAHPGSWKCRAPFPPTALASPATVVSGRGRLAGGYRRSQGARWLRGQTSVRRTMDKT